MYDPRKSEQARELLTFLLDHAPASWDKSELDDMRLEIGCGEYENPLLNFIAYGLQSVEGFAASQLKYVNVLIELMDLEKDSPWVVKLRQYERGNEIAHWGGSQIDQRLKFPSPLTEAMSAWAGGSRMDAQSFAHHFFDRDADDPVVTALRGAATGAAMATTQAELGTAATQLADAMTAVGLDHWPRFVAHAVERAGDPRTLAAVTKSLQPAPKAGSGARLAQMVEEPTPTPEGEEPPVVPRALPEVVAPETATGPWGEGAARSRARASARPGGQGAPARAELMQKFLNSWPK